MRGVNPKEMLVCISDLRLYLHQRYGLPLRDSRVRDIDLSTPGRDASDAYSLPPRPIDKAGTLEALRGVLGDCRRCGLCKERTHIVFGAGPAPADIFVVGEAPGAEEDLQAQPFVGRSGKLLTDMLKAIQIDRQQTYISNVVKCRPPQNRNPKPEEVAACLPFLHQQLRIIKPKLILALGTYAAQSLLGTNEPIMKLRGKPYTYEGLPMIVTLHPAACLYNPNNKKYVWQDIKGIPDMIKRIAR